MNEPSQQSNFRHHQEETADHQTASRTTLEFQTPEEILRHDAASVEVPAGVADRLAESAAQEPPTSPWWKRMFNG